MKILFDFAKKNVLSTLIFIFLLLNFGTVAVNVVSSGEAPKYMVEFIERFDCVYSYTINEMVRFVEKQYDKVLNKPDDFYASDLEYLIEFIWPNIPEIRKNQALVIKYEYLLNYYRENISKSK